MAKTMLITGGSQGIGAAVARLGAARGWRIALTYQSNQGMADAVVADIRAQGGEALAIQAEMGDEASITKIGVCNRSDGFLQPTFPICPAHPCTVDER